MKKKKSNTKWIIGVIAIVFISSIIINELIASSLRGVSYIDVDDYLTKLTTGEEALVLLVEDECSKCDDMIDVLTKVKKGNVSTYIIDMDKLSTDEIKKLDESSSLIDKDVIPSILHLSAGEVIGNYTKEANYNDIMSFWEVFDTINVEKFENIYAKDEENYVYIGRPTCPHCVTSAPWTKRRSFETGKIVYYINTDEEKPSDLQKLTTITEGIYRGATPLFMKVKNGKVVDYKEGAGSYSDLAEFFKE